MKRPTERHSHPGDTPSRRELQSELLDELTSHTPAGIVRFMRRLPSGPLSLVHFHVLSVLGEEGSVPMRVLAESLDVSQASATGIVDRMEQRGIVERRREDDDRRVIRVALTRAGRELIARIAAERRSHLDAVLDELSDEELAGFVRGSRALRLARERMHERLAQAHGKPGGLDPHATSGTTVPVPHSPTEAPR